MRLDGNAPDVRDWRDVEDQRDAALRQAGFVGREPPPHFSEVAPLLTPPQQVQWLTNEFLKTTGQQGPLTAWKGAFAPEDGLARQRLEAVVAAGEALAPEVAALVRWTLGVSPASPQARVVPALGFSLGRELRGFFDALVQRWPEGWALEALPAAGTPPRETRPAQSGSVRFPLARWTPTLAEYEETLSRGQALLLALLALWRAGAEDVELARFHEEYLREWGREPDTLARWVTVEDPRGALEVLRTRTRDPRPARLEERAVRDYASVRERIDALLGEGRCSVDQAARRLAPVERVTWALDELYLAMRDNAFHLWDQNWVSRDFDGPGLVSRIAVAAHALDPLVSDLIQWTARWAREGGVALVSVASEVWLGAGEVGRAFIHAVAERWPEALEPHLLPEPPRWSRPLLAPSEGPVRYPGLAIGFTPQGTGCPEQVPEKASSRRIAARVSFLLWRAGASDAELEAFSREYEGAQTQEPEVLSRWILFDGDGGDAARREALRERLYPQHPIAKWMGIARLPMPLILLVEDEDLEVLAPHLTRPEVEWIRPSPEYSLTQRLRSLLRQDPEWMMLSARELDADGAQLVLRGGMSGQSVILGDGPGVERLRETFQADSIPWDYVLDYRRGRGRRPA